MGVKVGSKFERGEVWERNDTFGISVNRALEVSSVENIKYAGNVENFRGSKQFWGEVELIPIFGLKFYTNCS